MNLCVSLLLALSRSLAMYDNPGDPGEPPRRVEIVGHRGAPVEAPENTLASFRRAIELGVDAIELDVHQTADSQLVVLHDASVNRTTDGRGRVGSMTLDEVRRLDAGGWFSDQFRGERIPTLQEVFEAVARSNVWVIVELKGGSETYPEIEVRTIDLIRRHEFEDRIVLKSFDRRVLHRLAELAPEIPRLYVFVFTIPWLGLTVEHGVWVGDLFSLDVTYLQPHRVLLTRSFVRNAQHRGYKVVVWDVHDESSMLRALEQRVDGIETDRPDILKKLLQNSRN